MPALVPTLAASLARADQTFHQGRTAAARKAYGVLLERAQDKSDRAIEVIARVMLAWCALQTRDLDAARAALKEAGHQVDPMHDDGYGRYRRVLARLAVEAGTPQTARDEVRDYLAWAEERGRGADALDGCLLLAGLSEVEERVEWLERGIETAINARSTESLGRAYNELAAALDQVDQSDRALEAYQQALRWRQATPGPVRTVVAAMWAVGASACRNERWALARERLEDALATASDDPDCADLVGWIQSDLARVYDAAGDVVGARHLVVAALQSAREQDLEARWPERFSALLEQADTLDVL